MYVILFLFWLILNGKITLEIVIFGLVLSAAIYWFSLKFLGYRPAVELAVARSVFGIMKYSFLLVKEVILANLATAKVILSFEEEPEPMLISFDSHLKTDVGRTLLANSITLTPGTITVLMEDGHYVVHGLDKRFLKDIDRCEFVQEITKLEEKALEKVV